MSKIKKLKDIQIYQEALLLSKDIYQLTNNSKMQKDYSLIDQLQRAALSIPANIAEGYGRKSKKDFAQFVSISLGSINEILTYLDFIPLEYNVPTTKIAKKYEILARRVYTFRSYLIKSNRDSK